MAFPGAYETREGRAIPFLIPAYCRCRLGSAQELLSCPVTGRSSDANISMRARVRSIKGAICETIDDWNCIAAHYDLVRLG